VSHPKTTFGPNEMLLCTQFVYDASNWKWGRPFFYLSPYMS
jgi:hypothetical protein